MYINKTEGKKYKFFKLSAKQQNLIKNFLENPQLALVNLTLNNPAQDLRTLT